MQRFLVEYVGMRRIIVVLVILASFAIVMPRLLTRLSLYFDRSITETVNENYETNIIFPPVFDPIIEATNEARFAVRGYSQNAQKVEIYINNILKDTISVDAENGSFSIDNLHLYEGENIIKGVAIAADGKKSSPSNETRILYTKKAPDLEITSPQDNEHFTGNARIKIEGKTDPGVTVKINKRWAMVRSDGTFTFSTDLSQGENSFEIIAEDPAGNKTTVARIVTYSQN